MHIEQALSLRSPDVPKEIVLSEEQLVDLCKVHLADYLNLVVEYKFWHYRRSELRDMVQLLADRYDQAQYLQVYKEVFTNEPADSAEKAELPEMVRARKLGIADKVLSGEISYADLQSHKLDGKI